MVERLQWYEMKIKSEKKESDKVLQEFLKWKIFLQVVLSFESNEILLFNPLIASVASI